MSSDSSLELDGNLDVGECPDIKTVQSSYMESSKKNDFPVAQVSSLTKSIETQILNPKPESPTPPPPPPPPPPPLNEVTENPSTIKSNLIVDHSFSGISSISSASKTSEAKKNFIQKNIEKTKPKSTKTEYNTLDIKELGLEEELEVKKVPINVDERFYKYQNKVQQKVQSIAQELKEKEQKICTFQPDIKNQSQRRTNEQFIDQMKNFEKRKKEKIENLRSQKEIAIEEEVHKPTINPRSKEILAKKQEDQKPIHEKLYQQAKPQEKSPPKVEKKVKRKVEGGENHLYEDALRRAAKQPEVKTMVKEVQASTNSQLVLARKFMKEFQEVFANLNAESETISLDIAIKGLVSLNFIKNNPEHPKFSDEKALVDKLFKLIGAEDTVKILNLLKICLAIINIYIPSMTYSEDSSKSPFGSVIDGNYSLPKEQVVKVHKLFSLLHENRQISNQIIKEIKDPQTEQCSFKPQINPSSDTYAKSAQNRSGSVYSLKRENFLQEEKKKAQEKLEMLKKLKEEEEKRNCTFKPTLISKSMSKQEFSEKDRRKALYEKSKEISEKKKTQLEAVTEQKIEKDMVECTFAPRLERIKVKEEKDILYSKSVQQQLLRMQKAREEQDRKKTMLDRCEPGNNPKGNVNAKNLIRSPTDDSRSRTQEKMKLLDEHNDISNFPGITASNGLMLSDFYSFPTASDQPKQVEDEEIQLEVKLPNGKIKTLIIPPGSDKELRISMFIIENRLNEDVGSKLRESLLNIK